MTTLIDTSVLVSLSNSTDTNHARAKELMPKLKDGIVTDYVLDETSNVISIRQNKKLAVKFCANLLEHTPIEFITDADFYSAWEIYQKNNHFSFTDCTLLALMKSLGIKRIATFDQEFQKVEGIEVVN